MRIATPVGRRFAGLGATVCLLSAVGATLGWRAAGGPVAPVSVAAADELVIEPPAPSTSTTTSSSSSTTSTTVTSTTVAVPRTVKAGAVPTTVDARPATTRPPATSPPATTAATHLVPAAALPSGRSPAERCAAARQWVAGRGLVLPAGWGFRCPGVALERGVSKWGVACWNCEGDGSNWIAVDVARIGPSDATLRYVVAHETCHANDYAGLGLTTELGADLCAALHGAPRP